MTWTKLSDDFADDCWTLSDAAFRMHVEGLVWSNRKLVDCHIELEDVRRFAKNEPAVKELLEAGLWAYCPNGCGYVIRHHAQYQESREKVIGRQARAVENGKKGGRPPKAGRERFTAGTQAGTQVGSEAGSPDGRARAVLEVASEPDPTLTEPRSLTQQLTQGDGPGRDGTQVREGNSQKQEAGDLWGWPDVAVPGLRALPDPSTTSDCHGCGFQHGHMTGCRYAS
ncbi:MAG TPA: hypothetical protein VFR07_08135 [Mycobacteriales bacterium]|jgi:hypothetical protein|nr:hypothetical protein [Mycobacteriales bacterium]